MLRKCPNPACQQVARDPSAMVVKHGFFRFRRSRRRRYRCRACGRTFSKRSHTTYSGLTCSGVTFQQVALLSVEGLTRAAIARIEGVNWKTVDRWLCRASAAARRFNDLAVKDVELTELQADELRTFAQRKTRATWVFTSIEICSRL